MPLADEVERRGVDYRPLRIAHPNRIGATISVRELIARHIREGMQCLDASGLDVGQFVALIVHIVKIAVVGVEEEMRHDISSLILGGSMRISQSLVPKYTVNDALSLVPPRGWRLQLMLVRTNLFHSWSSMQVRWNEAAERFQSGYIRDLEATLLKNNQVFGSQMF
jgi:hypothetical protein